MIHALPLAVEMVTEKNEIEPKNKQNKFIKIDWSFICKQICLKN